MRIGVISDTHGNINAMERSLYILEECDALLHLGDNVKDVAFFKDNLEVPIYKVRGNCDFRSDEPEDMLQVFEGKRVFMTHGHRYNVKMSSMNIMYKGMEVQSDIVLFGHTHTPFLQEEDGMWIMNPGSLGNPRRSQASVGIITIEDGELIPEIVEI